MAAQSKNVKLYFISYIAALSIFYISLSSINGQILSVASSQWVIFPIIAIIFSFFIFRNCFQAIIFYIFILGLTYSYPHLYKFIVIPPVKTVFFAPMTDDNLAAKSRTFRLEFQKEFSRHQAMTTDSVFSEIQKQEEIEKFFSKQLQALALVTSSTQKFKVFFNPKNENFISTVSPKFDSELLGIKVINQISRISGAWKPASETIRIVSASIANQEIFMEQATKIYAKWFTSVPKSYLFFRLGSLQLKNFYLNKNYQFAELDCAIANLELSRKSLKPTENIELSRAIYANLSLAYLAKGRHETDRKSILNSKKYILLATRESKKSKKNNTKIESVLIAKENLKIISKLLKDGR